jgi:hypothetical protein
MRGPGLNQAIQEAAVGSADSPLANLMKLAAQIADCPYSALIVAHPGRDQAIAGWGVPSSFYRQMIPNTPKDIKLRESYFQIDQAHLAPELETSRQVHELGVRFMVGVPVPLIQTTVGLSIICGDFRENVVRAPNLKKRLEDIAQICAGLLQQSGEIVEQAERLGQVRKQVDELIEVVAQSPRTAAFLDSKFHVIKATAAFEAQVGATFGRHHKPRFSTLFPTDAAKIEKEIETIFEENIPFRILSADFIREHNNKIVIVMRISGSDIGQPKYIIDIRARNSDNHFVEERISKGVLSDVGIRSYVIENPSITSDFLFNTLVENRKVTHRKQVAYHSIRRWKAPIKDVQIEALRALKKNSDDRFIKRVAIEILEEALTLYGANAFAAVAAVPCGHSGPNCLACKVAREIASLSNKVFYEVFEPLQVKGSSHPKANVKRPRMVLREVQGQPTLLVDDVATSGSHISEATKALREAGVTVFPIAWIGG